MRRPSSGGESALRRVFPPSEPCQDTRQRLRPRRAGCGAFRVAWGDRLVRSKVHGGGETRLKPGAGHGGWRFAELISAVRSLGGQEAWRSLVRAVSGPGGL